MYQSNGNGRSTWLVIADSSSCQIYQYSKFPNKIELIKELVHPENLLKDSDYVSDKQGSFRRSGRCAGHGTFLANADPKKTKIEQFSHEIAELLEHDRRTNAFEHLIIISPPHMNGLLNQHFCKQLKKTVDMSIDKSASHMPQQKLLSFVNQYTLLH